MRVSCNLAVGMFLIGSLASSVSAAALNAPHTLHRARGLEPHLTESHRAASHRYAAHASRPANHAESKSALVRQPAHLTPTTRGKATLRRAAITSRRHHVSYERFTANSFATSDIFAGDVTAGEDPVVRQAAIDALGGMNGTAVVIDPSNGRILAMVNQKLALSPGAEPCSTIKITVAMAALSEGLVTRDTMVKLDGFRMNMTQALAKSNNLYFEELGRELGFERVRHYATQFGLGELAGYNIDGEQLGVYPDQESPLLREAWRACAASARAYRSPRCSLVHMSRPSPMAEPSTICNTPPLLRKHCLFSPRSSGLSTLPATCLKLKTEWPARWSMEPHAVCAQTSSSCRSSAKPEPARMVEPV